MRDREEIAAEVDVVNSYMDDLHEAILEMHNKVQDQQKKKISRQQRSKRDKGKSLPNFKIGYYVMEDYKSPQIDNVEDIKFCEIIMRGYGLDAHK